jgi:hypothetical protein
MQRPLDLHFTIIQMIWIKQETEARHADLLYLNSSFPLCIQVTDLLQKKYKVNTNDPLFEKCMCACGGERDVLVGRPKRKTTRKT